MSKFAAVVVDSFVKDSEKENIFDYIIPDKFSEEVRIGKRVIVPFGRRLIDGYVINVKEFTDVKLEKLKSIHDVPDSYEIFNEKQIELARWMSEEYMCSLAQALKSIMPVQNVKDKAMKGVELSLTSEDVQKLIKEMESNKTLRHQIKVINAVLNSHKPVCEKELIEDYGCSKSAIDSLVKKGILKTVYINVLRIPYQHMNSIKQTAYNLTVEQQNVINQILSGYRSGRRNYLLHGVTGSGKTEVYMKLIESFIEHGKKAIVLVPEISLTPQTIERFKGRFQSVAVIHSRLSSGEKYDEWKRIKNGDVDVVVGARSAVFAPLDNLGVIIIDEEHEGSYKSDKTPKYHAREVAYKRCEIEGALLILGSATPSIETYYESIGGKYTICTMDKRVDNKKMPHIELVDMRQEIVSGNKTIFSRKLYQEIKSNLDKNNQTILFLNRRGFSTFVSCRECGLVMKCPKCDVSLTYHMDTGILNCHYCNYTVKSPDVCPKCKSKYIKYFGTGTQKIEAEVKKFFPRARVLRMDLDTTSRKGEHEKIYNAFKNHEADILIGTQMISKGLDFPGVSLVGIIAADQTLNIPDYKSCERTFQLITQVAGRSGRGKEEGRVIVQTYNPEHYSIVASLHQDYREFYDKEILVRRGFKYPPFCDLINMVISSKVEKEAIDTIIHLTNKIRSIIKHEDGFIILGPSPAPISKINTYFRWQTIIKGNVSNEFKNALKSVMDDLYIQKNNVKVNIDINPVSVI